MKSKKDMELIKHLNERKDFKVIFDGEEFGIYKYNQEKNRYEGEIGFIKLEAMIQAIEDKEYSIKLEIV